MNKSGKLINFQIIYFHFSTYIFSLIKYCFLNIFYKKRFSTLRQQSLEESDSETIILVIRKKPVKSWFVIPNCTVKLNHSLDARASESRKSTNSTVKLLTWFPRFCWRLPIEISTEARAGIQKEPINDINDSYKIEF